MCSVGFESIQWQYQYQLQFPNTYFAYSKPLGYSEVKATARSIAKFCWKNDAYCYQEFIDRQTRKGAFRGGKKSKRGSKADSARSTKPWEALGIGQTTYYRRKKKGLLE